ncbi:FUSC family protein [Actinacidiphila glaucinigra]|uniref:FUSC family protein n=1 Tax=Actinacidiphila glaucinigra TaxID=235986 RepID=UPI002DDADB62|nr:FUSC family protein [Actinacidiphila glaucinigra]WSD63667.1 FUSC family protein [Actinacidiphila glaucinigra]
MTWLRALRRSAREGLRIERAGLEPLVALRAAAGVAIVIGLSLWLAGPLVAASSAFGAFASGMATFQRSWRPRPVLALVAGGGLAVSTFLGYLAGAHWWVFVALLAVWAFLAGMAWALGPTAGIVSSLTVAVMLVVITLPTSALSAFGHALVIAAGGVVQAALIMLFPVRRWGRQRDALADAFAAEADYARRLRHDPFAPFDPEPLMTARSAAVITDRQARRRPAALRGKRVLAERIRPVLTSLADPTVGAAAEGPERDRARELLAAAASVLDAVARAVREAEPVRVPPEAESVVLVEPAPEEQLTGPARRTALRLVALLSEAVSSATGRGGSVSTDTAHLRRPSVPELLPLAVRTVRREARFDSPVFRHAVRLAAVTPAGYALGAALPLGHGYWAPLTSVLVMRPDFSQTYGRSVARFVGTLAGVTVATAVMQSFAPGPYPCAVLAVVSVALMYGLMRTGYLVSQVAASAYVVFLLGMAGSSWTQTVPDRVLLTMLGGVLAMAAYALFPAWETPRLRNRLADRVKATGRYAAAAMEAHASPARGRREAVRAALLDARAAALAWDQAVARADAEPVRGRGLSRRAADGADAALSAMGRVPMLMEAHLPAPDAAPVPDAAPFARHLRTATADAATAVRERRPPDFAPVRATLEAWPRSDADRIVRRSAELLMETLDDLEAALRPRPRARTARRR